MAGCHATGNAVWGTSTTADACIECHTNNTRRRSTRTPACTTAPRRRRSPARSTTRRSPAAARPATRRRRRRRTRTARWSPTMRTSPGPRSRLGTTRSRPASPTPPATRPTAPPGRTSGSTRPRRGPAVAPTPAPAATATGTTAGTPGVDHRTTAGTQSTHGDQGTNYDCYECHVLESAAYTFTLRNERLGRGRHEPPRRRHDPGQREHERDAVKLRHYNTVPRPATDDGLCFGCHTDAGRHAYCRHGLADLDGADDGERRSPPSATPATATATGVPNAGYAYPDGIGTDGPDRQRRRAPGARGRHRRRRRDLRRPAAPTCDRCHAGNAHNTGTLDLINGNFKTVSGAADTNGAASGTREDDITCSNIDCHNSRRRRTGTPG